MWSSWSFLFTLSVPTPHPSTGINITPWTTDLNWTKLLVKIDANWHHLTFCKTIMQTKTMSSTFGNGQGHQEHGFSHPNKRLLVTTFYVFYFTLETWLLLVVERLSSSPHERNVCRWLNEFLQPKILELVTAKILIFVVYPLWSRILVSKYGDRKNLTGMKRNKNASKDCIFSQNKNKITGEQRRVGRRDENGGILILVILCNISNAVGGHAIIGLIRCVTTLVIIQWGFHQCRVWLWQWC